MRSQCTMTGLAVTLFLATAMLLSSGCTDVTATLPAGTPNPSVFNNSHGALMKRNAADSAFEQALRQYVIDVGLLTDELEDAQTGTSVFTPNTSLGSLDERILPEFRLSNEESGSLSYALLQKVRGVTSDAIGALAKYDTVDSPAVRGEMHALHGYAEIMLAELFCSGVPLSTLVFEGDFTYKPSSTQRQVFQDAIVNFNSALALATDSARILNMARVGLGRAYLDLGDYTDAAAAVASVPDMFRYRVNVQWRFPAVGAVFNGNGLNARATVSNVEGTNGLPFITSGDPRTQDTASVVSDKGLQLYFPKKYAAGLTTPYYGPITLADGVEARLIQSEAALRTRGPSWLTILNALRTTSTTCTVQTAPCTAPAGTGGVSGLPLLVDPGSDTARVNLLFSERAYWLYLTGHRQGDLRRLVRQYQYDSSTIYPTGTYLAPGQGVYGNDVTAPIPPSETPNPYFHGCLDRNA